MGKTPKKAAPGGDERNSCVRRIKPTTASSKTSESEKQRESDYSNRPRLSNIQKKVLPSSTKKNKLHNTANSLNQQLVKNLSKDTVKEGSVQNMLQHLRQVKQQKMQSKLEEAESTSSSISIEIDNKEETVNDVDNKKEETTTKDSNANHTTEEQDSTTNTNIEKKTAESIDEDTTTTTTTTTSTNNETIQSQDKENEKKDHLEENNKQCDEQEQDEMQLHLRVDDSPAKSPDTTSTISIVNDENELDELPQIQVVSDEVKEKKSSQTESEAGTESCSVDIVESVTSELSEASEPPSQQDTQKERENLDLNAKNEMLGINYDASVTLKDVQIKLNDCLKEKLKHVEVCESDDNNISNLSASNTFGKTLRNISGRTAIDRFRHSSSYDFWVSPNNSQSTNISMSQSPRRDTTNTKILRYSTGLSDVMSSNGSFVERKRKLADSPESTATLKKQKTEQSSLLNTSMDIIRGLRKPIQISTPNISYKEQSDKLNISEINDGNDKFLSMHTTEDGTKKWCVIM